MAKPAAEYEKELWRRLSEYSTEFTLTFPASVDVEEVLQNVLLYDPRTAASITGYRWQGTKSSKEQRLQFSVEYVEELRQVVVLVRNMEEFRKAVRAILRLHKKSVALVIDNQKGFVEKEKLADLFHETKHLSGLDYDVNQIDYTSWCCMEIGKVLVLSLEIQYMDSAAVVSSLCCQAAELALRNQSQKEADEICDGLYEWMKEHFTYQRTDGLDCHSAASMMRGGSGVCQAAAVYAWLYLSLRGLQAHIICGEHTNDHEKWGAHAWIQVYRHGKWVTMDYTGAICNCSGNGVVSAAELQTDYRWDTALYGREYLNSPTLLRVLAKTELKLYPDRGLFLMNGCPTAMTGVKRMFIHWKGKLYVPFLELLPLFGAFFQRNGNLLEVFLGGRKFTVPLSMLPEYQGIYYTTPASLRSLGLQVQVTERVIIIKL